MRLIQLPALAGSEGFDAAALGAWGFAGARGAGFAGALFVGPLGGARAAGLGVEGLGVEALRTGAGTGFFAAGALVGALAGMGFFVGALVDIVVFLAVYWYQFFDVRVSSEIK